MPDLHLGELKKGARIIWHVMGLGYWLEDWGIMVHFLAGTRDFSILLSVQTDWCPASVVVDECWESSFCSGRVAKG